MRHLPRHYSGNSTYSLFPFYTPAAMKDNLTKLGIAGQYSGLDGKRPQPQPIPKVVDTIEGLVYVLADPEKYGNPYTVDMKLLTEDYGFFLNFDEQDK